MHILAIMDLMAEIEDRAALLYHSLSVQFRNNPAGYTFWEQISREEKRHADMARTYRHQRLTLPIYLKSHQEFLMELQDVRDLILQHLKETSQATISGALEAAYNVEENLSRVHMGRISEIADPILVKLMVTLGQEDRRHQDRIIYMVKSLSG